MGRKLESSLGGSRLDMLPLSSGSKLNLNREPGVVGGLIPPLSDTALRALASPGLAEAHDTVLTPP